MALDINKALRNAIKTGKIYMGSNQTLNAVDNAQAKAVVLATNCPKDVRDQLSGKVPIINFSGMGVDLGTVCGKPFAISALTIIEPGESEILSAIRE
ncbi:MAG: 50S ribosomal protein L30e [Methanosarcinales archaeon]|nr:50S ribosomal protein L30e [Methanosarcinales archaeon]